MRPKKQILRKIALLAATVFVACNTGSQPSSAPVVDNGLKTWKFADGTSFTCGVMGDLPEKHPFGIDCDYIIDAKFSFRILKSGKQILGWQSMRKDTVVDEDGAETTWNGTASVPNGTYDIEVRAERGGKSATYQGLSVVVNDEYSRM